MKMKKRYFALGAIVAGLAVIFIASFLAIVAPTNSRDSSSRIAQSEMIELSQKWGQLAPFPTTSKNFVIKTEGGAFSRSFRGSFQDSPSAISKWRLASKGIFEGKVESQENGTTTYILKTAEAATYGEVIISEDGSEVSFYVSWS